MKNPTKMFFLSASAIGLLLLGYFQGYLHGVAGVAASQMIDGDVLEKQLVSFSNGVQAHLTNLRGGNIFKTGILNVKVEDKPFGMHVKRGSLVVEEVFPGFPAEKLGIHPGCTLKEIGGQAAKQGTWVQVFQSLPTPFELSFFCSSAGKLGNGPLSGDKHNFRTMVVKKPYGMNIQVHTVPRVIDVLPGSPAEAAGVKRGFVLTHVNDQKVDPETWFNAWQTVKLPSTLTFDTAVPVHKDNPFFNASSGEWLGGSLPKADLPDDWEDSDEAIPGFQDVWTTVKELPFGMHVHAIPGKVPVVKAVSAGLPAEAQGIKAGDVLVKVAGAHVDSSTWFAAFQHAVPPFGLRFRRPDTEHAEHGGEDLLNPKMPHVGDLVVQVKERPFGMHVHRGSDVVGDVFAGTPAYKVGVRKGCHLREIAEKSVSQGTWMDIFQKQALPFSLTLFCPKQVALSKKGPEGGKGPLNAEEHDFRVKVAKRPFGMNIQSHTLPRVHDVLPGYPAEAAGVKAGFVLTAINGQPVDADNWFDIWQSSSVGTELTFHTNIPVHENNPFVDGHLDVKAAPVLDESGGLVIPSDLEKGHEDFRAAVKKIPFGMQVTSPKGGRPTVRSLSKDLPAEAAGVKVGDVLISISGVPVDSSSWFAAFQQAAPPFGLRFRRPNSSKNSS